MTQQALSSVIFSMIFSLASYTVFAGNHNREEQGQTIKKETKATVADQQEAGEKAPVFPEPVSKTSHGKATAPHMEELPHIHKFHKERVKKIRKHHSKYWFLTQVLLALCHLSILIIGYLHVTH